MKVLSIISTLNAFIISTHLLSHTIAACSPAQKASKALSFCKQKTKNILTLTGLIPACRYYFHILLILLYIILNYLLVIPLIYWKPVPVFN